MIRQQADSVSARNVERSDGMERTLTVTITTNPDIGTFDVNVLEGESGCTARFTDIPCEPEHEAFNRNIGNEIYSWAALMMDEEEENEDE